MVANINPALVKILSVTALLCSCTTIAPPMVGTGNQCESGIGMTITDQDATELALTYFKSLCSIGRPNLENKITTRVIKNDCLLMVIVDESIDCIHGGNVYVIDGKKGNIIRTMR